MSCTTMSARNATSLRALANTRRTNVDEDLDNPVLPVGEHLVGFRYVLQRHPVGDDQSRVELSSLDVAQQIVPVFLNEHLGASHCLAFLHVRANGEHIAVAKVVSYQRDASAFLASSDHLIHDVESVGLQLGMELYLVEGGFLGNR